MLRQENPPGSAIRVAISEPLQPASLAHTLLLLSQYSRKLTLLPLLLSDVIDVVGAIQELQFRYDALTLANRRKPVIVTRLFELCIFLGFFKNMNFNLGLQLVQNFGS